MAEHAALLHPLPTQPTTFIGRRAEVAEISELLATPTCRLLTLVGPGGIGKTRLALETTAQNQAAFADGVLFVLSRVGFLNKGIAAVNDW